MEIRTMKNEFEQILKLEIEKIKSLVKYAEENNLINEQYYLSFENELNYISVLDHNKYLKS